MIALRDHSVINDEVLHKIERDLDLERVRYSRDLEKRADESPERSSPLYLPPRHEGCRKARAQAPGFKYSTIRGSSQAATTPALWAAAKFWE